MEGFNPTPDPNATETKTIDQNEEGTPETTTASPSDETVPSVNVKQQVKKLNIAELASISNKKKTEYIRVKEIASQEIQKLQAEIEKNSKQLADYVQTKPKAKTSKLSWPRKGIFKSGFFYDFWFRLQGAGAAYI